MARFQIEGDVFANLLNGPADEHVPWDFYACESGRIYPSFNRVVFVDIQAQRSVGKSDRIQCVIVSHGKCRGAIPLMSAPSSIQVSYEGFGCQSRESALGACPIWIFDENVSRFTNDVQQNGLRSRDRKPCSMLLWDAVSAAERIERFLESLADAGENRRVAQGVARAFGFAKRHHEIQEVFGLIAFEGHHPLLIVQPE